MQRLGVHLSCVPFASTPYLKDVKDYGGGKMNPPMSDCAASRQLHAWEYLCTANPSMCPSHRPPTEFSFSESLVLLVGISHCGVNLLLAPWLTSAVLVKSPVGMAQPAEVGRLLSRSQVRVLDGWIALENMSLGHGTNLAGGSDNEFTSSFAGKSADWCALCRKCAAL